jgi:hypothetical protein
VPPIATLGCDLLSNIARLCIPSIRIPLMYVTFAGFVVSPGGTLLLNIDILITALTFGALFVGTYILEGKRRRPY